MAEPIEGTENEMQIRKEEQDGKDDIAACVHPVDPSMPPAPSATPDIQCGDHGKSGQPLPIHCSNDIVDCPAGREGDQEEPPGQALEEPAETGFQSGLGIRKALRLHWGATVKMWDEGIKDISEKVKGINPPPPNTPPPKNNSEQSPAADCCDSEVSGTEHPLRPSAVRAEHVELEDTGEKIDKEIGIAQDDEVDAAAKHDPWSPVVRPLSKAMAGAKSMGIKLADVWDIHDIFDDVKQQRDYWRKRREEKRQAEQARQAEAAAAASIEGLNVEDNVEKTNHGDDSDKSELLVGPEPEATAPEMSLAAERAETAGRPEVLVAKQGSGRRRHRFGGKENSVPLCPKDPTAQVESRIFDDSDPIVIGSPSLAAVSSSQPTSNLDSPE